MPIIADSSFITSVDWIEQILFICTKNGPIAPYAGVPKIVYDKFLNAPSKGHYYNKCVKGIYPHI